MIAEQLHRYPRWITWPIELFATLGVGAALVLFGRDLLRYLWFVRGADRALFARVPFLPELYLAINGVKNTDRPMITELEQLLPALGWLALALFLVGLGWNLCYIAGSSLLSDILAPSERAPVQGTNELVINLASAASSLSSGFILAGLGYAALGLAGAGLALLPLALVGWHGATRARLASATET